MTEFGEFKKQIEALHSFEELEKLKAQLLGKKGDLSLELKKLGQLSGEERRKKGEELNVLKKNIFQLFYKKREALEEIQWENALFQERIDTTLPSPTVWEGYFHPINQVIAEIIDIFISMGFSVRQGPDIETDYYNFTALCVPAHHPSRTEQDTFYFLDGKEKLLRTQTSGVQIRVLEKESVPLKIIAPGRVYRPDNPDATHSPMFHQIEGLAIGEDIHMGHLKGCMETFYRLFFGRSMEVRFRPGFFPFVEPGAEVDIPCQKEGMKLEVGVGNDWLELFGCGMVHPQVLENCGVDSKKMQGFAFGLGVDRLAMVKYGIPDVRCFFNNDQRWLRHYGFPPCTPGL